MFDALVLAAVITPGTAFLDQFSGAWTCGNAHYHEAWRIGPHVGTPVPGVAYADVEYGDPARPDGRAFVYYNPTEHAFRYDDFHADGTQSHLTSPGPVDGVWAWTGIYYPIDGQADPSVYVTWKLEPDGSIARVFAQHFGKRIVTRGADRCARTSAEATP